MKDFIKKCTLFSIPILLFFLIPLFVFILSGEILTPRAVFHRQEKEPHDVLFQSAFTIATEKPYKLFATVETNPEVLMLGFSRVLTFQESFFKEGTSFYNAGRGIHAASDLVPFLSAIPRESRLKVIILDLSDLGGTDTFPYTKDRKTQYDMVQLFLTTGFRQAYLDYGQKKFTLSELLAGSKTGSYIGLSSIIHHGGYRRDGSLDRGDSSEAFSIDKNLESLKEQVDGNIPGIVGNFSPDLRNIQNIEKFLELARERNIYVVGYFSPYASGIFEGIQSLKNPAGDDFLTIPTILHSVFMEHNYHLYDLRDLKAFGSSDRELYDAGHPTEKGTLHLLEYLAKHEPILQKYVDMTSFKQKIDKERF